ncbi:MAG: DUF4457 domain-containing protein [Candidatus Competibacteraceae bacterium]|nr:DUF4457 domain-containing protein [Candidatus Competibacteraceae bacterium]
MTPQKLIDGSQWGESFPGSGVFVHGPGPGWANGGTMWSSGGGDFKGWIRFDLGEEYQVSGAYVWNYNESGEWRKRGLKQVLIQSSTDGESWSDVGTFDFALAPGTAKYEGEAVAFAKPIKARYFKFQSLGNHRNSEQAGLSEVRFANAEEKYVAPSREWKPKYARPTYPQLKQGQPLPNGGENFVFPADAGVVDVSLAPYFAKGDGVTDDTAAIQKALDDNPNKGAIIYLPNGRYLISKTLRWGGPRDMWDGSAAKSTALMGQSREGTILQLKDNCPGFEDTSRRAGMVYTGQFPAQRFWNQLVNLTFDTGTGNPGASGVQFIANNTGGIYNVSIHSGDGQGVAGVDLAYTDEQGPLLIQNVSVKGFNIGVWSATSVASVVMEHVTVEDQNVVGLKNDGQPLSVRGLISRNSVPAAQNNGGLLTLIDSTLTGTGDATKVPALANGAAVLVRNLTTTGYATAIDDRAAKKQVAGPNVTEHRSIEPKILTAGAPTTLNLPIKETPVVPWGDVSQWVNAAQFGKDSAALQKAIDSGAETVYLPRGSWNVTDTVIIRGKVRRIIGTRAWMSHKPELGNKPFFRFEDGEAPVVVIEGLATGWSAPNPFLLGASKRTLVMQRLWLNNNGPNYISDGGTGDVFIDDVSGSSYEFKNQNIWARQLNPEQQLRNFKIINDGARLWALGYKVEGKGSLLLNQNGAATEFLGGLSQTNQGSSGPMVVNEGGDISFTIAEVNNSDDPFTQFVVENLGGKKQEWGDPNKNFKGFRVISYESRSKP